jgi:hypothetical protein
MRIATALIVIAISTPAFAQRPDATRMTCQQATTLVQRQGAVILGLGGDTFDRVVRDEGFCERTHYAQPLFTPTLDNRACLVGSYCKERNFTTD